jgi:heme exporter protein A
MAGVCGALGLQAAGLDVERGGRLIIDDLSFELKPGQAMLLNGQNGAGKTTLIRAIAELLPVRRGRIAMTGSGAVSGSGAVTRAEADERLSEQCHYVAHMNAAKPELTVRENLRFWARFLGGAEDAEHMALDQLRLRALADIPVRYLSAGQQRRVAIGRLLVVRRPLWLLDEPSVSLDAANTARLVELGNEHLAAGGMIIAATHITLEFEPMTELRLEPVESGRARGGAWDDMLIEAGA